MITRFGDNASHRLALVINSPPRIARLPVDLHKHLIDLPAPIIAATESVHPLASELRSEDGAKPVPLYW